MALTRSTDPLVWIDCEMTGLNPQTDTIMSIACILTTWDLQPLDAEGFEAVIQHTPAQLSNMSEWCVRTHGATGLTQRCLSSTTTAQVAAASLLAYIKHYIPEPGRALLAGNSIHADKSFLMLPPWNMVLEHLHYRLFDVSAMKEMVRRWAKPEVLEHAPQKQLRHSAREDILESLDEARYYKMLIEGVSFRVPEFNPMMGDGGTGAGNLSKPSDANQLTSFDLNQSTSSNSNQPTSSDFASRAMAAAAGFDNSGPGLNENASLPQYYGVASSSADGSRDGGTDDASQRNRPRGNDGLPVRTPALGAREEQEANGMRSPDGDRDGGSGGGGGGDTGMVDAGYRTDVP